MLTASSTSTRDDQSGAASFPRSQASRLKIAQLVHDLSVGGAELLAATIARSLRHLFDFTFICTDRAGPLADQLRDEGFPVHVLHRRPGIDWRCLLRLRRLLSEHSFDVLHAHQYTQFFAAATARVQLRPTPILFTEHGRHFPDVVSRKRRFGNRFLLRKPDRVVGVGEAVRAALVTNERLPSERVEVVYNGVAPSSPTTSDERRAIRSELGFTDDHVVVLQVGRLDPLKDHATALKAFSAMHASNARSRLVLIGDGPERRRLEVTIDGMNLRDVVQLLGTRHDVPRLWHAADIGLLTSVSEGIPLTLLEAMAAQVPVVATKVGGVGEIIEDEQTGLLAPAGDSLTVSQHLLRLAADAESRNRLGQAGLERMRRRFSLSGMTAAYQRIYQAMGA